MDLKHIPPDPERPPGELEVVPGVLDVDQVPQDVVEVVVAALLEEDHPLAVLLRAPEAVDRRDAGHDDNVASREEAARRRVPQAVYVLVDLGVLLDKRIRPRDVRLRLVVVVVGDEVLDGVVREEVGELARELGRQRLVVRDNERGPAGPLDNARHRVGLARPGDAEQGLGAHPGVEAGGEPFYGLRLVAGRYVIAVYLEVVTPSFDTGSSRTGLCRSSGPRGRSPRSRGSL